MTTTTIATTPITLLKSKQFEMEVKEGLIFILNHLDDPWPMMISTYATKGGQRLVNNFTEAMAWFKASNFLDCRISAYAKYIDFYINRTGIAPSVLLVDIDKEHFKTAEEFELTATRTYTNFHNILGSRPTQLWTGGGYHFLIHQHVPVLEKLEEFSKFDQPSRRFMHFEEQLLTDNKADQNHWSTVSFNNCMLRIPWSINSKCIKIDDRGVITDIPYESRVRIVKRWDGNTPSIERDLLIQYRIWLQFAAIRDIREQRARKEQYRKYRRIHGRTESRNHDYDYIEKLLDKPLGDFRKYCIWRILVPYYINVKGLSKLQTFDIVNSWLDKCNSIARLDFSPKQKIDYELKEVANYTPIRVDQLKGGNPKLYTLLQKEGVI